MVYIIKFKVDGGCRGNGRHHAIGAAAAVLILRNGSHQAWTRVLDSYPTPTNQRAELEAIILALEKALEIDRKLRSNPRLEVKIYSDSKYAVGCMTDWVYKWARNGWTNAAGNEVANRDLIERASDLDDDLNNLGSVDYFYIPRAENELADEYCNDAMDGAWTSLLF